MSEREYMEDYRVGETFVSPGRTITEADLVNFAMITGDWHPIHVNAEYAKASPFGERIAHGMLTGALVSAALAMELPGPGTIYLGQSLAFRLPVKLGDTITVSLEVTAKQDRRRVVTLDCRACNQAGKLVPAAQRKSWRRHRN